MEDDQMVARVTTGILEKALKSKVHCFQNGEDALTAAGVFKHEIHLLLTDVVLPGMNGRMLSESIRELFPGIKVLYMSDYTEDAISQHGVLEKGLFFIPKPFSMAGLLKKTKEVMSVR